MSLQGAIAAVLAIAVMGCGGAAQQRPDEAAVAKTTQRWIAAVVRHDEAAACAELSIRLQKAIDRHILGEGAAGSCRTWGARWVSPRNPAAHAGTRIASVRVRGRRAIVHLSGRQGREADARLVNEQGRWRIDDF